MKSKVDLYLLEELAGTMPDHAIADRLHRSVSTIRAWAYTLHLSLAFKNQEWTREEVIYAMEMSAMGKTYAYIGTLLGRSPDSVRMKLKNAKNSLQ